jgi:signal transduction histidine kinase
MLGIVAALVTFGVLIEVRYRDGLEQRLHTDLTSGASALNAVARTAGAFKSLVLSLALEGISVEIGQAGTDAGTTSPADAAGNAPPKSRGSAPAKGPPDARGSAITKGSPNRRTLPVTPRSALVTVHEVIPLDGQPTPVALSASRTGIDRQVRSLEVTEAIGGAIALALLAALAWALVRLDRAVAVARASEAAMRMFLSDASHELRTPAAALHATAERLLRDQPERPQRDAIEAQLARDSGRLGHLIDDLLNLARLDARERPHREPFDLADLASAAVAATRANDPNARVELIAAGPVPATGDREALLRAVRNLLDNAFAVADTVVVEVTHTANGPAMSVTDNGPGVPPDQRERIFEPFVRLPRSRRRGTGLGLAIVRRTIESHGGTITCDPSPNGGARFTLRLPADAYDWREGR